MKISKMSDIPANSNPFNHDFFHTGVDIRQSGMVVYNSEKVDYLILVDTATGKRRKISVSDKEDRVDFEISILNAREGRLHHVVDPETITID